MTNRANLVTCKGLITNENELSVEQGSLREGTNVNVDEQGVITPRRGFNDYGGPTTGVASSVDITKQVLEYKDRLFRHYSDSIEFEDNTGEFNLITGSYNEVVSGLRIKYQEAKSNMYFTTDEGIKRISLKDNSSLVNGADVSIEQAGVPKAASLKGEAVDASGGFLPTQSKVGYRFIFGRKDENNNLLLGSPSSRTVVSNTNADDTSDKESFDITVAQNNIANGDYVIIPTASRKVTLYFDTDGSATEPVDASTFGTTFIKVDIQGNVGNDNNCAAILANTIINNMPEYTVSLVTNVLSVTSNEDDNIDNATYSFAAGGVTETSRNEGSVTLGIEANVDVTVYIPSGVTTDYFIQVYRTAYIQATDGLELADIDPGDESNLVYEYGLEAADITAGEYSFTDSTPESFRASATPLYTNEVSGSGILQSNDPPPIATDIELFRNSMFYANTKSNHRLEFTIISVDDYVNNSTAIVIGNSTISRYYTAAAAELADTTDGGDFELSTSPSVAIAIDDTSRSLVKIINQDTQSPVNAYYLSGSDDLPGQILLEARSLVDDNFYIAVDEPSATDFGAEFSPALPLFDEITSLEGLGATTEVTMGAAHGYSDGDSIYVSFNDTPEFSGVYVISNTTATTFEIPVANVTGPIAITNATAVFKPDVESDNLEAANRIYYSKTDRPEAVPFSNFINVGAQDEPIRRILALRDNLFVLKDDGVFIVSGSSAPNFTVRQTDNTRIIAPDSAVVLNNQIYCLTDQGITKINGSGSVGVISRGIENLIDSVANAKFDFARNTFGISYENDRAYIIFMPENDGDDAATQAYRYNIFERTWTRWEYEVTCGIVKSNDNKLYLGNGDRNYISQERKEFDRTDHSDREFANSIVSSGVTGSDVQLSSTLDVEEADVITQVQEVSINYLNNRLLLTMDNFDSGITPPVSSTMVESFGAASGDRMATKMQDLNDYLVTLDAANISVKVINTANLKQATETLIDELNTVATISTVKDYEKPVQVTFEAYITNVDVVNNTVTIHQERPFIEGAIIVFKHIIKTIEWNPQHFGDPSALKQVREVTVLLDQNNFYSVYLKFGSDVAQNLVSVAKSGKGIGYWGDMDFSNPNAYWGGEGNDIPLRTVVPRGKQRCRYLTLQFVHNNAREDWRILGITGVVRSISSRAYK